MKNSNRKDKKMNAKTQSLLDKVYALYNDDAAKSTKESEAALRKLKTLCKKHKVDFEAYMASKATVSEPEPEADAPKPKPKVFVFRSRRDAIIQMIKQNVWDKRSIAEAVVFLSKGKYTNIKQNLKAVSGTIYDINAHTDNFIKRADDGRLCWTTK